MIVLKALKELLDPVAPTVFKMKEDANPPFIHLTQLPGVPSQYSWESIDHIQIDVYGSGISNAFDLSQQVSQILEGYAETSHGLIDDFQAEIKFWHEAIASETTNKFSGTYYVTYRN